MSSTVNLVKGLELIKEACPHVEVNVYLCDDKLCIEPNTVDYSNFTPEFVREMNALGFVWYDDDRWMLIA